MINQENSKYDSLNQPVENKQQLAYQQIKQDILNNPYPAGTVMVERKLCEIYNVSRSPIRNALQQLTHEGLLSFVPGIVISSLMRYVSFFAVCSFKRLTGFCFL